jgi:hypothetical protein
MVTDVAQYYRSMDAALAQPVLDHARNLGCERIVLVGAHLAEVLLEAPIPAAIHARVDEDRTAVEHIARRVIAHLFMPNPPPPPLLGDSPHVFSPLLFRMRERRRDRLTYLLQTTTTPVPVHLNRFPLPKWAYPAYRLIVPVHDYVVTPVVHGVRALLRSLRNFSAGLGAAVRRKHDTTPFVRLAFTTTPRPPPQNYFSRTRCGIRRLRRKGLRG